MFVAFRRVYLVGCKTKQPLLKVHFLFLFAIARTAVKREYPFFPSNSLKTLGSVLSNSKLEQRKQTHLQTFSI